LCQLYRLLVVCRSFFFQAEDGIRDFHVTGVQTCALPISLKDHLEIINHKEAIEYIEDLVSKNVKLSEYDIKSVHYLILKEIDSRSEERRVGKECRDRWREDE